MLIKALRGLDPGGESSVWDRDHPCSHLGKSFLHNSPKKSQAPKSRCDNREYGDDVVQHLSQQTAETEEFSQKSDHPWSNTPTCKDISSLDKPALHRGPQGEELS